MAAKASGGGRAAVEAATIAALYLAAASASAGAPSPLVLRLREISADVGWGLQSELLPPSLRSGMPSGCSAEYLTQGSVLEDGARRSDA